MSQGWIEGRVFACEQRIEKILRELLELYAKVTAALQAARTNGQQYAVGSSGSEAAFYCQPSSTVAGATGSWPAITAASFTADVYTTTAASLTLSASSATVYNFNKSGLVAHQTVDLVPDGAGNFNAYSQSCT
jgi:hypothetical protein